MLWTRYPRQWAQLVKLLPLNDYDDEVDDMPDALSLVRSAQRGSFLLGPLLFIVQGRTARKGWQIGSLMDPRAPRVSLISEPGCGSFTIWSTLLQNVSRLLHLRYHHFRLSGLQPLMHLKGAEPRKPVSVFSPCTVLHVLSLLIQLSCSPGFSGFLVGSRVIGTVRFSRSKIKNQSSSCGPK